MDNTHSIVKEEKNECILKNGEKLSKNLKEV